MDYVCSQPSISYRKRFVLYMNTSSIGTAAAQAITSSSQHPPLSPRIVGISYKGLILIRHAIIAMDQSANFAFNYLMN